MKSSYVKIVGIGLFFMIISHGCSKKNMNSEPDISNTDSAMKFANTIYGKGTIVLPNQDSSYFLCYIENSPNIKFTVTNLNSQVVLKQKQVRGTISWNDINSIRVMELPGVIEDKNSKPSDYIRIIKINTAN